MATPVYNPSASPVKNTQAILRGRGYDPATIGGTFETAAAQLLNQLDGEAANSVLDTLTVSGATTLGTTIIDDTTPSITLAAGQTNTGFLTISGKTSGGLKLTVADASAFLVTATLAAQTSGTAALTIPNFAGVADEFVFKTKSVTMSNKTFIAPVLGVATATSINGNTITTGTGTLTLGAGSTLATSATNSITLTSTGATNVTLPTTGTLATLAGSESLSNKTLVTPIIGAATGTSLAVTAGLTSSGPTGAGIGYATGAGGTVTQITDATTAVELNKLSGQITTVTLTLAAGVDTSFTLTNSTIAAGDVVVASIKSYGGTADGIPVVNVVATAAGSCVLNIRNTGAVTLDALAVVNFAVIKAVAA